MSPDPSPTSRNALTLERARDFRIIARSLMQSNGNAIAAANYQWNAGTNRARMLKTAVTSQVLGAADSEAFALYRTASAAWLDSLRQVSVFDTVLPFTRQVPMRTKIAVVTTGAVGSTPAESKPKPISKLVLDNEALEPQKSAAIIVLTKELAAFADPVAGQLFDAELQRAVAAATDSKFLADLYAAVTPTASAGATTANILTDLETLVAAVDTGATSRLFLALEADHAKKLATKQTATAGQLAFPGMTATGSGQIAGIRVLPTDQLPSGGALLIDADGLAAATDAIVLDAATQASIEMVDTASDPATASTVYTSLFQTGQHALRAERWFAFALARSKACAALSGVAY